MNDPVQICVTTTPVVFNSSKASFCGINVQLYFEDGTKKLYRSKFVLPCTQARICRDMITRQAFNDIDNIRIFYEFMMDYNLFEFVLKQ